MYIKEIECEGVDWIYLIHDGDQWRVLVNTIIKI
jgi:hypothetical protein